MNTHDAKTESIIGIDLGTTNGLIAVWNEEEGVDNSYPSNYYIDNHSNNQSVKLIAV